MNSLMCILLLSTINVAWCLPQISSPESTPIKKKFCEPDEDCVNFFICNKTTETIQTDGREIISVRIPEEKNTDGPGTIECTKEFHVCCKIPKTDAPITSTPEHSSGCGYRNSKEILTKTAVEKTRTEMGEFPWMMAIFEKSNSERKYLAGGSLIHPSVVLTSAHNFKRHEAKDIRVYAGKWDIVNDQEIVKHQERDISEIRKHSQYHAKSFINDVALLFLTEPFKLGPTVQTICLPPMGIDFKNLGCTVTGWGKNSYEQEERHQETLKKIDLPFVDRDQCENLLKTKDGIGDLFKNFTLDKSFVCAGGQLGNDACSGDGGSPLICPIEGQPKRYHQIGVVSWGIKCGEIDLPGMYANVQYLKSWIDEQMIKENFRTSSYTI